MWQTKVFKTKDAMLAWLKKNQDKIEYEEIAVNNAYGVLYRKIRWIG